MIEIGRLVLKLWRNKNITISAARPVAVTGIQAGEAAGDR
jgi:hypothetical protein